LGIEKTLQKRRNTVTNEQLEKVTASRNRNYEKIRRERPTLSDRSDNNPKERITNILTIWPKMVEYAGLSEYEAKVYLSLLTLGSAGARRLSLHCHVPRTKVYGTLKKLIDYGLVVEIPGAPKAFAPASPEDAFSAVLSTVKYKAVDFSTIVKTLTETHEVVMSESSPKKKVVWYLNVDDDIMGKCHEIMSQSEKTVIVLTTADGLSLLFNSAPRLLDQLQEQGVEVRLYSPLDPKTNPLARELSYLFAVKKVEIAVPILFIDSDHTRFMLAKLGERTDEVPLESAIFSDDSLLLALLSLLLVDEKQKPIIKSISV